MSTNNLIIRQKQTHLAKFLFVVAGFVLEHIDHVVDQKRQPQQRPQHQKSPSC